MRFRRLTTVTRVRHDDSCCPLDARSASISAAIYSISSSLLVVCLYIWRVMVNGYSPNNLKDVYWGVQIAYLATMLTHIIIICLSVSLLNAIYKERTSIVAQWVVVNISLMAFEAVCCSYSNVLRDHINKRFDAFSKAELLLFLLRLLFNIVSLWSVIRFLRNIGSGMSYKDPETIEL